MKWEKATLLLTRKTRQWGKNVPGSLWSCLQPPESDQIGCQGGMTWYVNMLTAHFIHLSSTVFLHDGETFSYCRVQAGEVVYTVVGTSGKPTAKGDGKQNVSEGIPPLSKQASSSRCGTHVMCAGSQDGCRQTARWGCGSFLLFSWACTAVALAAFRRYNQITYECIWSLVRVLNVGRELWS